MKSIRELAWNVSEEEYRRDKAFSYSTLSAFLKEGPEILVHKERVDTDSLRFGSLVDCLITEPETLNERFLISDFKKPSEKVINILNSIWDSLENPEDDLTKVDDSTILRACEKYDYCSNYKDSTKLKYLMEGKEYFRLLTIKDNKILISQEDYELAEDCVNELQTNPFTANIINVSNDPMVEDLYQLKFKTSLKIQDAIIPVRCMFDKIRVDHSKKIIYPFDLKTTSKKEFKFGSSAIEWNYYIQATLYRDILLKIIAEDSYFSDFTVDPFRFIVINRYKRKPMLWRYDQDNYLYRTLLERKGYKDYIELLYDANWHMTTGRFDYPRSVYINNGELEMNIEQYL